MISLAEGVRELARQGTLWMIVSDESLKRAAEAGLRVREYAPPPNGNVQCTVAAQDDILTGRLAADLAGAKRVDFSICDSRGAEMRRLSDIPIHAGGSGVIYQASIASMKAVPTSKIILRLYGLDEQGGERLLGEYTFNHTRSLPGPGASS